MCYFCSANLLNNVYAYFDWHEQGGRLDWFKTYTLPAKARRHGGTVNHLLQHLAYDYDSLGNIENLYDYMAGNPQTQTFTYDSLNRLTSAQATGGTIGNYAQQSYTYDASTGNLATKAGVNYGYNDAAQRPVGCHAWQDARLPFAYSCSNSRLALLGYRRRFILFSSLPLFPYFPFSSFPLFSLIFQPAGLARSRS